MKTLLRAVRGLWIGWLAWRIFGPELQPRYRGPQTRPLRLSGHTVFVGDKELFVREIGPRDATPLVLAHGWSFDGEMTFHRIIPALAEEFRLIVPDHRNHGRSDWIRGRYEIEDLADELAGVLDALGVERASVFGYSLGGMVTQALAHRHPDRVDRIILAATAARPIPRLRAAARVAFWMGRSIARISRYEMARLSRMVLFRSGSLDRAHDRWMYAALLRRDPTLFYEAGHAAWRFDARPWVGSLAAPAMVIIPTDDKIVLPEAQYELASLVTGAEVVELVGVGHESILNRAGEYVKHITRFVTADR